MSAILTRREAHPLMLEVVHLQHEYWKKKKKRKVVVKSPLLINLYNTLSYIMICHRISQHMLYCRQRVLCLVQSAF